MRASQSTSKRASNTRGAWRWASLRLAALSVTWTLAATTGCAANQDVKTASTEVSQTLSNVRDAEKDFNQAVLAELEQTRAQVARAIVAGIVFKKISSLASDLESKGDLIGLAREISDAQTRGELFVERISTAKLPDNVDTVKVTDWLTATLSPPPAPPPPADFLAQMGVTEAQVGTLLRIRHMELQTKMGLLSELDQHLNALLALHAQIDQWIQTDATVKGEDVAKTIETVAQQFPKATAAEKP